MMSILKTWDLHKSYRIKGGVVEAVRGVSLQVAAGEVFALLGPNGAGKTTTIKMVLGLVRPDSGEIRIKGRDPLRDRWALREVGAVLEGNRNLYWRLTPLENLEYFGVLRGLSWRKARQRGRALLERLGLEEKAYNLTQTLSRGMQQKLALASALIHRPALLLLDEPTLGLDVEAKAAVQHLIREISQEGRAVLLTTHQLDVVETVADRVAVLYRGMILTEGSPQELTQQFASGYYLIELARQLPEERIQRLQALGAEPNLNRIIYRGDLEGFWQVLEALRPLEILAIHKDRVDLTEAFLRLIKEGDRHAAASPY